MTKKCSEGLDLNFFMYWSTKKNFVKIGAPLVQKCSALPEYSQLWKFCKDDNFCADAADIYTMIFQITLLFTAVSNTWYALKHKCQQVQQDIEMQYYFSLLNYLRNQRDLRVIGLHEKCEMLEM